MSTLVFDHIYFIDERRFLHNPQADVPTKSMNPLRQFLKTQETFTIDVYFIKFDKLSKKHNSKRRLPQKTTFPFISLKLFRRLKYQNSIIKIIESEILRYNPLFQSDGIPLLQSGWFYPNPSHQLGCHLNYCCKEKPAILNLSFDKVLIDRQEAWKYTVMWIYIYNLYLFFRND